MNAALNLKQGDWLLGVGLCRLWLGPSRGPLGGALEGASLRRHDGLLADMPASGQRLT